MRYYIGGHGYKDFREFDKDLEHNLQDPEFAAHFYNAQQESLKELNQAGISPIVDLTSLEMNKTQHVGGKGQKCPYKINRPTPNICQEDSGCVNCMIYQDWLKGGYKMHAELCPVCNGKGVIYGIAESAVPYKTCHGCGGTGWVTVADSIPLSTKKVKDGLMKTHWNKEA